ncbi:MAG: DUF433 domain-containing protein [Bacteroidetes bacterium]|nr:DUF433 domain-containing protein [Bacteroidota bacterium]
MEKYNYITADPLILGGKPIIRGTRISVELILEWISNGSSIKDINKSYPHLSEASIKEAVQYATEFLRNEIFVEIKHDA